MRSLYKKLRILQIGSSLDAQKIHPGTEELGGFPSEDNGQRSLENRLQQETERGTKTIATVK